MSVHYVAMIPTGAMTADELLSLDLPGKRTELIRVHGEQPAASASTLRQATSLSGCGSRSAARSGSGPFWLAVIYERLGELYDQRGDMGTGDTLLRQARRPLGGRGPRAAASSSSRAAGDAVAVGGSLGVVVQAQTSPVVACGGAYRGVREARAVPARRASAVLAQFIAVPIILRSAVPRFGAPSARAPGSAP